VNIDKINRKVFAELGREKQLIEYHDIIYKLLGIVVDFINADGESLKLSRMKHFNPFCAMLRGTPSGFTACQNCDRSNAHSASLQHRELVYRCHAGLNEVILPLYDSRGNYIGSMTSGQFLLKNEEPAPQTFIADFAELYGLDAPTLYRAYRATKRITPCQLEGILDYLWAVGRLIVAAHNKLLFLETIDAPDKIAEIKQYVADHYMKKLTVPETARKFFFSAGHFSRFFKQELGVSFMTFVNMYRISQAEKMLRNTRCQITEIAFNCGFGSISQFNRVFKNVKGISAQTFRLRR